MWVSCSGVEVEIGDGGCGGCKSNVGVMEVVSGCEREEEIMGVVVMNQFGYFEFVKIWGCVGFTNDILSLFKFR